jgi:formate-dependent nitrite reductase membrane component NrfD
MIGAFFNWPSILYFQLVGMAFGVSMLGFWLYKFSDRCKPSDIKFLFSISLACLFAGTLSFLTDFSPELFFSWNLRLIVFFVLFDLLSMYSLKKKKFIPLFTGSCFFLISVIVGIYPTLVLMQAKARPLWDSYILILLFALTGIHSGFSLIQIIKPVLIQKNFRPHRFDLYFVFSQALLFGLFVWLSDVPVEVKELFLSEGFGLKFLIGVIIVGWILPLVGYFFFKENNRKLFVAYQLCFLVSAYVLRYLIVEVGQSSIANISN